MGNPCGKIIQNGTEYDLIPYAHKISVNGDGVKTYSQLLKELSTKFYAAVSDPNTDIHCAVLKTPNYTFYVTYIGHGSIVFSSTNGSGQLVIYTIGLGSTYPYDRFYSEFDISTNGVNIINRSSDVFQSSGEIAVYYS